MANIHYEGINQTIACDDLDASLLDISMENKIPHLHECGGNGKCTTCRVRILEGNQNLTSRTFLEREMAQMRNWDPSIRLACQTYLKGDVSLQRLVWTSAEVNKLQIETVSQGLAEERTIAILFCDLRNFTSLASKNLAFDTAHVLNRFYTVLGDPILMNNGIIYQYVGDEIVGIFGTSGGTRQKNCLDAVRAALGMQYAIKRLNSLEMKDFGTQLEVGIGINYGKAFVGHLGHPRHRQFAVVGDPVNIASRIQGMTRDTGCPILISESTLKGVPKETLNLGKSFVKKMKGIENAVKLYALNGFSQTDINLELQSSLDFIMADTVDFSKRFYERVFEAAPSVRGLFKNDMAMQGRMLTHMLIGIVYSLSRPEHLVLGLKTLGKSHQKYGVRPEHYPVVKEALLKTIEEQMADDASDKVRDAWSQALDLVTDAMKNWEAA